jgi:hypothetical protein
MSDTLTDSKTALRIPVSRRYSVFPSVLGKSLEGVLAPVYKKHGFAEHRILTQWHSIVGDELAGCSIPQKITYTRGATPLATLHVLVQAARALELQHMHPVILSRITGYFGYAAVAKLAFIQSAGPLFAKPKKKPALQKASPENGFTAACDTCEDAELRAALVRLAQYLG